MTRPILTMLAGLFLIGLATTRVQGQAGEPIILRPPGSPGVITWITEPREAGSWCSLARIAAIDTPDVKRPAETAVSFLWPGHPKVVVYVILATGDPIEIIKTVILLINH